MWKKGNRPYVVLTSSIFWLKYKVTYYQFLSFSFTASQRSGWIFSHIVSVRQSAILPGGGEGGSPCDHHPSCIGPHCTRIPTTWDLRPPSSTSDISWKSLKTCSNLFIWRPNPHEHWHLVATTEARQLASGRYASYWNPFLVTFVQFVQLFCMNCIDRNCFHQLRDLMDFFLSF